MNCPALEKERQVVTKSKLRIVMRLVMNYIHARSVVRLKLLSFMWSIYLKQEFDETVREFSGFEKTLMGGTSGHGVTFA